MKKSKGLYSTFHLGSALFMILALLWLTISAPFVYISQQQLAKQGKMVNPGSSLFAGAEEETSNCFGNTTEEKAPNSSSSFSEEYLHDHHIADYFYSIISQTHKCENSGTYTAYHGEVQVPPPNRA